MSDAEHGRRFRARAQEIFADTQLEVALDAAVDDALAAEDGVSGEDRGTDGERCAGWSRVEASSEDRAGGEEVNASMTMGLLADEEAAADEDDEDEELACLQHALRATSGEDHEVLYDLGARAHERGDAEEALRLYEKAEVLNPVDALLLGNMGAALLELGRRRDALRCFRRAMQADAHDVNARFNAGEMLLADSRLRALGFLLDEAPEDAMEDEGLQWLAAELQSKATKG